MAIQLSQYHLLTRLSGPVNSRRFISRLLLLFHVSISLVPVSHCLISSLPLPPPALFSSFSAPTGDSTQSLAHARQSALPFEPHPQPLSKQVHATLLSFFEMGSFLPSLAWNSDLSLPCSLGWQVCATVPSYWEGSLSLPSQTGLEPNLNLLTSWDHRCPTTSGLFFFF
jgi:hypothetical protein